MDGEGRKKHNKEMSLVKSCREGSTTTKEGRQTRAWARARSNLSGRAQVLPFALLSSSLRASSSTSRAREGGREKLKNGGGGNFNT